MPDADKWDGEAFDKYISAEVLVPKGDMLEHAKVIGRKRDRDGNAIGHGHSNPIMDTRILLFQYDDGHVEEFAANIIAEHIFAQVDEEGNQFVLLEEIVDHKKDGAAVHADDQMVIVNECEQLRKRTKGWKLAVV
jgi:hypothetical protein